MRVRVVLSALVLLAVLVVHPADARAWSSARNGFGTHDWVLNRALAIAKPKWVDTQTALLATDDPDSLFGREDRFNHSYHGSGLYRGGPDAVATTYKQLLSAYRSHDTTAASTYLGWLSHYYSDLCVPMHTGSGYFDHTGHLQYELWVNSQTSSPGQNVGWVTLWNRTYVKDVRAQAVEAAMTSRSTYDTLVSQFESGQSSSPIVQMVTRMVLSRAANDLADIIMSVPKGTGVPAPVTLSVSPSHRYPAIESSMSVKARCTNAKGLRVEGVRVRFTWRYPSGTVTTDGFTGTTGEVRSYADRSQLIKGRRVTVTASIPTSQGAATSLTSKTTWFVPTDEIGYMRATISSEYPAQRRVVAVSAVVLNTVGEPMTGLPVTFRWRQKSGVVERTVSTGADGIARHSRNIGAATKGYRITVDASARGGGLTRTSSTRFTPQNQVGKMTATVGTFSPSRNTTVTVSVKCLDSRGSPMSGVPVTFKWRFRSTTWSSVGRTDSRGIARSKRNIKKSTRGFPIRVTGSTRSGSGTIGASTWFTPR